MAVHKPPAKAAFCLTRSGPSVVPERRGERWPGTSFPAIATRSCCCREPARVAAGGSPRLVGARRRRSAGSRAVGVVAVDGTMIEANASHRAVRSYDQILAEAAETDARGTSGSVRRAATSSRSSSRRPASVAHVCSRPSGAFDQKRAAGAKPVPRDRCARLRECKRRLEEDLQVERATIVEHEAWLERGIASDGSRRMVGARARVKPHRCPRSPSARST